VLLELQNILADIREYGCDGPTMKRLVEIQQAAEEALREAEEIMQRPQTRS